MIHKSLLIASVICALPLGGAATANAQPGSTPFANCTQARANGQTDIPSSSPYYGPWLDKDHDGIGCES
ncbi:excalibur calcium-binding domain-containing protein [Mycolicibacterium psychrotolerans]|uniref:excalibur calcium-binding domain-containing protein n=1 Tax=Mycolicibacterium psychrotolerans TaxID=216929 RepID=UPI0013D88AA3|nr:excalibur calcium-binding domain-containing protein [Mycolicibacterium psychrotolerans]